MLKTTRIRICVSGIVFIFALFLSSLACSQEDESSLQMTVNATNTTYRLGEPITIDVSFRNVGDSQLVLCFPWNEDVFRFQDNWELVCNLIRPDGEGVILPPISDRLLLS